ncbi:MAG: glycosyltransferase, partial [Pseudomonadales bacterium]|nr:glycosyltransferase [Pseudomonadales bacterium]
MDSKKKKVDIIIPVYAGTDETLACIESVCESLPKLSARAEIVVLFDAGPDLLLRNRLLELASQKKITLIINETNLGFVRCINRGIQRSDRDVLLLNSDTLVANDWLDRIVKHAYTSSNIATVTPFSNNAEICSWPNICESNDVYKDYDVDTIDEAFAALDSPAIQIPTAVGFCMFIKRECIDRIGMFDAETYGRGYGEENDFCMRASALNFTHLLATNVYVHHHGAVSFGAEKQELVRQAMVTLDRKYPSYHAEVAQHIADDPARRWRFAAELILRSKQGTPMVLHISHGIGGGTDKHVVELSAFSSDRQQHAMLVPQTNCMRLVFPNVETGGLFEFPFEDFNALKNFLFSLSLARIHIHHVKGWEGRIYDLLQLLDVPYDITLHDYYFLHVNPALVDKRGHFCVEPRSRDALSADAIPFPKGVDAEQWRERWKSLLKRAERV